jgi:hypothetical protein
VQWFGGKAAMALSFLSFAAQDVEFRAISAGPQNGGH